MGGEPHGYGSPARGAGVTDTPADVQARVDALMRQRSGSDRVRMMSDMFDFAKALALANLRAGHPGATAAELRVLLFDRLYGSEIAAAQRATIVACLGAFGKPI
jgi:hypothetical protein